MRQWNVDPELMCDNHLLGEHNEIHKAVGSIESGRSIQGHIDKGQLNPRDFKRRHDVVVSEMKKRDMNHNSPLESSADLSEFDWVNISKGVNIMDLWMRCDECHERIEERANDISHVNL